MDIDEIFARLVAAGQVYDAARQRNREQQNAASSMILEEANKAYNQVAHEFEIARAKNPDWESPRQMKDKRARTVELGQSKSGITDPGAPTPVSKPQKTLEQSFWEG